MVRFALPIFAQFRLECDSGTKSSNRILSCERECSRRKATAASKRVKRYEKALAFFCPSGRTIDETMKPLFFSITTNSPNKKTNPTHRSRSPPSVSSTMSMSYALLSTSLGGIVKVNSLPWRGPTSTNPSHRASVPRSPGRSCGCLQQPMVGDPGAVAVTAARDTDGTDESMSRASVARTGWATRPGRCRGGQGDDEDDDAEASSTDKPQRRRRRRSAAGERAIVRLVSFCAPEERFPPDSSFTVEGDAQRRGSVGVAVKSKCSLEGPSMLACSFLEKEKSKN